MTIDEAIQAAIRSHEAGRLAEAAAIYRQVLHVQPDNPVAVSGLGDVHFQQGDIAASIGHFQRLVTLQPDSATAHTVLGIALLTAGDFARGWREFEWRWLAPEMVRRRAALGKPMWDGQDLAGRRILLHGERGGGDTIHFIRYLPLVAARGGRIILTCQPELHSLVQGLPGVDQLVKPGEALPEFDVHCALVSLGAVFQTTLETIPAPPAYLWADPAAVRPWRERMAGDGKLKVGLVWAGQPNPPDRSVPLAALSGLGPIANVSFYSLQKGEATRQARSAALPLIDWTEELKTFGDTAALIENLDLVISVDTSVAQLAGAMGKRVWTLLKFVPDWRWMLHRVDSPWYPSMRLFRQPAAGAWQRPIEELVEELRRLA